MGVQYAHNTSNNATTGVSPYQLLFHQKPNRPECFAVPAEDKELPTREIKRMDSVFRKVKRRIRMAQEDRRKRAGGREDCGYRIGDVVRIKLQPSQRTLGKKLHTYKSEVYVIVEKERADIPASTSSESRESAATSLQRDRGRS